MDQCSYIPVEFHDAIVGVILFVADVVLTVLAVIGLHKQITTSFVAFMLVGGYLSVLLIFLVGNIADDMCVVAIPLSLGLTTLFSFLVSSQFQCLRIRTVGASIA